ncbi:MAG: hypothetical protein GY759_06350, partial [Chloroflexi bacterium]|nr:hypothetical protein [Chloroflexota bacterium]
MRHTRRPILILLTLVVTLTISAGLVLALDNSAEPSAEDAVFDALEHARAQTSYHVVADTQQTLIPQALSSNAGKGAETSAMRVLGDVTQDVGSDGSQDVRARLQFHVEQGDGPVEFVFADKASFVGYQGRWQEIEHSPGGMAPGGDYLGYLDAVTAVEEQEPTLTAEGSFRHFTFAIDGGRYAEIQRAQMQQALAGQLPQGVQLQASPTLQAMTGQGELWLDEKGLPRRQALNLDLPAVNDQYDAVLAMTIDFSGFGDAIPTIVKPGATGQDSALVMPGTDQLNVEKDDTQMAAFSNESLKPFWTGIASTLVPVLLALPLLLLALHLIKRRRTLYAAVVWAMIIIMVVQPLLHVGRWSMFARSSAEAAPLNEALQTVGVLPRNSGQLSAAERAGLPEIRHTSATAELLDCSSLYVDVGSQPKDDDDNDGLSNEIEWCLGTDYTSVDSDGDTITDTVELQGFSYNNQHWTSNPLSSDSNGDGISDGDEWSPKLTSDKYTGPDAYTDKDNDGVPNLWDDDNDGDGVQDDQDISPYKVTAYRPTFDLAVTSHATDTTVYIDVQVQPQTTSHLRYSLTSLDWPSDDLGQIQDLDQSSDDITLIPVLSLQSTISPTLSSEYSILSFPYDPDDLSQGYSLWVPLQPVAMAGNISAFSARMAFSSDEADQGINLTEGKILWLAQAVLDSCLAGTNSDCDTIQKDQSVIASYYDTAVRLSGLNVSEYKDVQVGLFGTSAPAVSADPTVADEDKVMFSLISAGLGGSFLYYINPDLEQIETNFNDNSAVEPYINTWGIDPAIMSVEVDSYAHRDEALASTTQTNTAKFLDDNYVNCTLNTTSQITPTVALAYQETRGLLDMSNSAMKVTNGNPSVTSSAPLKVSVPLGETDIYTWRRVQLSSYGCDVDSMGAATWAELSQADTLAEIASRYPDAAEEQWMGMVQQLFLLYHSGVSNIVAVNGKVGNNAAETAPSDTFSYYIDDSTTTLPDYVRKVYQLDSLYLDIDSKGMVSGLRDWRSDITEKSALKDIKIADSITKKVKGTVLWVIKYNVLKSVTNRYIANKVDDFIANDITPELEEGEEIIAYEYVKVLGKYRVNFDIEGLDDVDYYVEDLDLTEDEIAEALASTKNGFKAASAAITIITSVIFLIVAWLTYSHESSSLTGAQKDFALVNAWVTTYLILLQFLLSMILLIFGSALTALTFTGIGAVIGGVIFIILYIIVGVVSGDWNPLDTYAHLTEWWAEDIEDFKMYVAVPAGGVNTSSLNMTIDPASSRTNGPLSGAWFQISTTISTTVAISHSGTSSDVGKSWALTRWEESAEQPFYLESYSVNNSPIYSSSLNTSSRSSIAARHCDKTVGSDGEKDCYTDTILQFKSASAGRNAAIPIVSTLESYLTYYICIPFQSCGTNQNYSYSGADNSLNNEVESDFYIDLLPATLDGLFTWNAKDPVSNTVYADFNVDQDNDELSVTEEHALGTDATLWDSDGDGLSDGWESQNSGLGVVATLKDTDGDGLTDKQEVILSTSPSVSDTDGDGLNDGEEVCHLDSNAALAGGWRVTQAGNYWTCSDPLFADYDGDGLVDSQEKQAGLSPYSPNTAPSLRLTVNPNVLYNQGLVTVLRAGDAMTVAVNLNNTTAETVDRPLILNYAVQDLTAMTVVTQTATAGYTPLAPIATTAGLSWDLAANPLYSVEAMTTVLHSSVYPNISQSQVTTLQATLQYTDADNSALKSITQTLPILIDEDEPTSSILTPAEGQAIDGTTFTTNGAASDPTSWPATVDVRISGDNSYDSGWQRATGATNWAWTWTPLPADGVYTMQSRATDYVNNVETPGSANTIIVDNTPPGASFSNLVDGQALTFITANRVTVGGSATDLLSGASQVAGLEVIQLSIDGRPWTNVAEFVSPPHPTTSDWSYDWTVNAASYGSHTLAVRAVDALGQIGDPTSIEVIIDTLPPTNIWSNYQANLPTNQAFELLGHADDEGNVPLPARPHELENFMDSVISATVMLMPESFTDTVGMNVSWLGDVNGDARADLAVGMPAVNANGNSSAGRVAVVYGQAGGWPIPSASVALADSAASYIGSAADVKLGEILAPAGDANGDGLSDFWIGDPANNQAYLLYGQANGLSKNFNLTALSQTNNGTLGKIYAATSGDVGEWVSSAGDVNGDGFDDLLVGVTDLSGGAGAVYLVKGRSATSTAGTQNIENLSGGSAVSLEYFQLDNSGAVATGVGDVNGDQYHDFVIADPNNSFGASQAAVYLFLGPVNWRGASETGPLNPLTHASASFIGDSGALVGSQVTALGDVNGDDLPDFAYSSNDAPRIVYGRSSGWSLGMGADVSFSGYSPAPNNFIATPGDVNVDGFNDILLGATGGGGRAYLVHGSADLATNQPVQAQISGVSSAASAPYATGPDLNCDLSSDLLLVPTGEYTLLAAAADGNLRTQ